MNKVKGILGIATAARKISYGETVLKDISNHNAKLVLISDSASDNTKKKLSDKCKFYHIDYEIIDDLILNEAIGRGNVKGIAINDNGFAKKIKELMKG